MPLIFYIDCAFCPRIKPFSHNPDATILKFATDARLRTVPLSHRLDNTPPVAPDVEWPHVACEIHAATDCNYRFRIATSFFEYKLEDPWPAMVVDVLKASHRNIMPPDAGSAFLGRQMDDRWYQIDSG